MNYIKLPAEIHSKEVASKGYSLSASQYKGVRISNKNCVALRDLLDRPLKPADKGTEVGSQSYISQSPFQFVRTKGLQRDSFLPSFSPESVIPVLPSSFKNYDLKKNDILISKDSNVGETVILDRDYPHHMISGGIYRLPLTSRKLYIFGLLKSDFFKDQLSCLVPRGTTIKHAKTLFLDCKLPFPNQENNDKVIEYIERLVETIMEQEKIVKKKSDAVNKLIGEELLQGGGKEGQFEYPTIKTIEEKTRLDAKIYSKEFQQIDSLIRSYRLGYFLIDSENIKSGNTPEKRATGKHSGFKYLWITPTNITDFGTLGKEERIACETNNLNKNAMLLVNRTSRGGRGEYVGTAMFFDKAIYGQAQHNQGIYRVSGYPDTDLLFMSCFMNSEYMRHYCAKLSIGSKMKEIKASQILEIPFPDFPDNLKGQIARMYQEIILTHENTKYIKHKLEIIVGSLVAGEKIDIDLTILKK